MIFDIAAVVFVLIFSFVMMKRGGMRAILSLGGFVLSIAIALSMYPALTDMVYKTPLPENLEGIIKEAIVIEGNEESVESVDALPDFMKNILEDTFATAVESATISIAETLTRAVINVIIFVLLIVVTKLAISLLSGALNLVTKLPVLHEINALVGLMCGLAISLVIVWLATMLAGALATSSEAVNSFVADSRVVAVMSNISPF